MDSHRSIQQAHHANLDLSKKRSGLEATPSIAQTKNDSTAAIRALHNIRLCTPDDILYLQKAAGNQAVNRSIQTKLIVGAAGDAYEQQADQVADQIFRPDHTGQNSRRAPLPEIKGKMPAGLPSLNQGFALGEKAERAIQNQRGSGRPLPAELRQEMETKMGADFSAVRLHTNDDAAQLNRRLAARAFTHGRDIYLDGSRHNPSSQEGKRLLAHELTHVLQQTGKQPSPVGGQTQNIVSHPSSPAGAGIVQRDPDDDKLKAAAAPAISAKSGNYQPLHDEDVADAPAAAPAPVGRHFDASMIYRPAGARPVAAPARLAQSSNYQPLQDSDVADAPAAAPAPVGHHFGGSMVYRPAGARSAAAPAPAISAKSGNYQPLHDEDVADAPVAAPAPVGRDFDASMIYKPAGARPVAAPAISAKSGNYQPLHDEDVADAPAAAPAPVGRHFDASMIYRPARARPVAAPVISAKPNNYNVIVPNAPPAADAPVAAASSSNSQDSQLPGSPALVRQNAAPAEESFDSISVPGAAPVPAVSAAASAQAGSVSHDQNTETLPSDHPALVNTKPRTAKALAALRNRKSDLAIKLAKTTGYVDAATGKIEGAESHPAPIKLPEKYKDEDKKIGWRAVVGDPRAEWDSWVTRYYSKEEQDRNKLTSATTRPFGVNEKGQSEITDENLYAMSPSGEAILGSGPHSSPGKDLPPERRIPFTDHFKDFRDKQRRDLHHSSIFAGGDVAHAGHIRVNEGKVDYLDDDSGHYRPDAAHTWDAYLRLKKQNQLSKRGWVSMVNKGGEKLPNQNWGTDNLALPFSTYEQTYGNEEQARNKNAMLKQMLDARSKKREELDKGAITIDKDEPPLFRDDNMADKGYNYE